MNRHRPHPRVLLAILLLLLAAAPALAQEDGDGGGDAPPADDPGDGPRWPRTRAERTKFAETSTHEDVLVFLKRLQRAGADITVSELARTTEGRSLPLVVAARPRVASPAQARRSGKPIVYVQANIHAGEVEGKEVALALLRELFADEEAGALLEKLIFIVAPIYNADGNDAFGPIERNRPGQNGPERVGRRPNGMGLDLNRDCIKAESPEMRGVLRNVYGAWDPDVVLDLHTTNGTRHGYHLTYSPPLMPDTVPAVLDLSREVLSAVRERLQQEHGLETFDYGNVGEGEGEGETEADGVRAWRTFSPLPRYVTNYAGVRNRIGILSEATSYRPFEERVLATHRFVREVLAAIAARADEVVAATRAADAQVTAWGADPRSAPALGVRFAPKSRGEEAVLLEKTPAEGAERPAGTPTDLEAVTLPVFDRFEATRTRRLPRAYVFGEQYPEVAALLARHGVVVEKLLGPWKGEAEVFGVTSLDRDRRAYQGHLLATLEGEPETRELARPAGSYVVRTAQPLGLLAFHILEAESTDGAAAWGLFDRGLRGRGPYPVVKVYGELSAPMQQVAPPDGRD